MCTYPAALRVWSSALRNAPIAQRRAHHAPRTVDPPASRWSFGVEADDHVMDQRYSIRPPELRNCARFET